jgi:hypothetical protein
MKVVKALLAASLIWIAVTAASPWGDLPDCLKGPFNGITATDPNGEIIGHPDHADWGCTQASPADARVGVSQPQSAAGVPVPPPPPGICLQPASPNPTSGNTVVRLTIGEPHAVRLTVYGQTRKHGRPQVFLVKTLIDQTLAAGVHSVVWNGTDDQGQRVPAGIYRVLMESDGQALCGDIQIQ